MTALEDIRVLELTQVMAGPFCCQVLAMEGVSVRAVLEVQRRASLEEIAAP